MRKLTGEELYGGFMMINVAAIIGFGVLVKKYIELDKIIG